MIRFAINPLDYDDYISFHIEEDDRVYRFLLFDGSEAYAIKEPDEDYDDFVSEVERIVSRRKGRRACIRAIDDVTGTFDEEEE